MRQIERIVKRAGATRLTHRVFVPGPAAAPESHRDSAFWNAAIDAIRDTLRSDGADLWTVPMSGGHGVVHLEERSRLGQAYLRAIASADRAHAMLRLLNGDASLTLAGGSGAKGPRSSTPHLAAPRREDHYHAKEFRLAAMQGFEAWRLRVDGRELEHEVDAPERWMLVLAAMLSLACEQPALDTIRLDGLVALYVAAVERCADGESLPYAISSDGGDAPDGDDDPALGIQWNNAMGDLANAGRAPAMLARLFLRVLCQRLFVTLPSRRFDGSHLFAELLTWLDGQGAHGEEVRACLEHLAAFGGSRPLDPCDEPSGGPYPTAFRPYDCTEPVRLDELAGWVTPKERAEQLERIYLLAARAVDELMDPLLTRRRDRGPATPFDWPAYQYLSGRMGTVYNELARKVLERADLPDGLSKKEKGEHAKRHMPERHRAFANSRERLQLQRLFEELSRPDERTVRLAGDARLEAGIDRTPCGPGSGSNDRPEMSR